MNKSALLSTSYFGPIQYFTKIYQYDHVIVEKHEHFSKQTYRNRCNIFGSNGLLTLSIPIQKAGLDKTKTKDIRLSYDTNWQINHWKSIVSAYNRSPFFEYYQDDIFPLFQKKQTFLLDLNHAILEILLEMFQMDIDQKITYSKDYFDSIDRCDDFRDSIHPKKRLHRIDPNFTQVEYTQVFSGKHGFIDNLSILDLLFNEGPNAINILKASIRI